MLSRGSFCGLTWSDARGYRSYSPGRSFEFGPASVDPRAMGSNSRPVAPMPDFVRPPYRKSSTPRSTDLSHYVEP